MEEIVSVVENDINPTLGKLQEELKNFKAWSEVSSSTVNLSCNEQLSDSLDQNNTLIQQLERFCLASKYHQCTVCRMILFSAQDCNSKRAEQH